MATFSSAKTIHKSADVVRVAAFPSPPLVEREDPTEVDWEATLPTRWPADLGDLYADNPAGARTWSEVEATMHRLVIYHAVRDTEDNVLGDPLSRGPRYMAKFREEARKMGAASFVRMDVPPLIMPLLPVLAKLHPGVLREEYESQMDRSGKPSRPRRSPSPDRSISQASRSCTIGALGIQRSNWRYVASFAGLGTMLEVAPRLGGEPACGSGNYGMARALWQHRTKRTCFNSFATYRAMLTDPEQRAHHLARVLIYLPGPPCIDFSIIAGRQRGTDGNTGQLFLDDAEGALETDAPITISETVLGILDAHLIVFLRRKAERLRGRYVAC